MLVFAGVMEYNSLMESIARAVRGRLGVAADLVRTRILCDCIVNDIKNDVDALFKKGKRVYLRKDGGHYPRCILWYVLDDSGKVVLIPQKYNSFLGVDFSKVFANGFKDSPHHYQSILTGRSVVGMLYPLDGNFSLVVERDLVDIIPAIRYFTTNRILPQEEIFVLSATGRAIYHPDEKIVRTRENLAFEMGDQRGPDRYGFITYSSGNKKYLSMSRPFAVPAQWRIYYTLPMDVIHRHMQMPLLLHLSMLLGIFGIMFLLLWFSLNRFFSRPVKKLVEAVERRQIQEEAPLDAQLAGGIKELDHILQAINTRDTRVSRAAEQLKAILNSMDARVYVGDMDSYELLFVNDRIRQEVGDVVGQRCYLALHPGQEAPCTFCTNNVLVDRHGRPKGVHIWEYEDKASKRWYECRDRAIPWTDGRLVRIEISTDITWRKEIEKAIFTEKERLAVTLASIGDGVITTDTKQKIVLMNPVAEEITGWSQDEARGTTFSQVVQLLDQGRGRAVDSPVRIAIDTGEIISLDKECILVRKDGTRCNVSDSAAPIFDRDGSIIGAVVVFRDITKELLTQQELLKMKKLETVGVLAGGIAHDFNNIISAIMGNIELAQYPMEPSSESYRQLDNAIKACHRAHEIALQLLTFSKGGRPIKKCTPIPRLIKESADFVLHGSKVICSYLFQENLWMVHVDQGQIGQVVQNLVLNSIHAMPNGGELNISCSNCREPSVLEKFNLPPGKFVRVDISDTGSGIPDEIIDKIFEPYFSTKHTGSGLGLAIVHSIVSKHGGAVGVSSTGDEGTTFSIFLPVCEKNPHSASDIVHEEKKRLSHGSLVLVMDDDQMVRGLAIQILKVLGHEAIEAKDGRQAIEIYRQRLEAGKRVDLLIMDLTIPGGMGGVEAINELLRIDSKVKAVVASGYSNDPVMSDFERYGFKAALLKPYSIKELGDIINFVKRQA